MRIIFILLFLFITPLNFLAQGKQSSFHQGGLGPGFFARMDAEYVLEVPVEVRSSGMRPSEPKSNPDLKAGKINTWNTEEFSISVAYYEIIKALPDLAARKAFLKKLKDGLFIGNGIALISNDKHSPGKDAIWFGIKGPIDDSYFIRRIYLFRNKLYMVSGIYASPEAGKETNKYLDSFRFADAAEIAERRIKYAEPSPFPQAPEVKKAKSDAEDEGIKGKVKFLLEESDKIANGAPEKKPRKEQEIWFSKTGNFHKLIYYLSGQPDNVSVFGYLEGMRVYKTGYILSDNSFGDVMAKKPGVIEKPRDLRYDGKNEYSYDDEGRLRERLNYSNDGSLNSKSTYSYDGLKIEEARFDGSGKKKYSALETIDSQGNVVEKRSKWDSIDSKERVYLYKYETFDKAGNWTRRIESEKLMENGKEVIKPIAIETRKIEYY